MINQHLDLNQLKNLFGFIFQGKNITILRLIKQCGFQKVTWIHYSVGINTRATFIAMRELNRAYLLWLDGINIFDLPHSVRQQINQIQYHLLQLGDAVFSTVAEDAKTGIIVGKAIENNLPRIFVQWNGEEELSSEPGSFLVAF